LGRGQKRQKTGKRGGLAVSSKSGQNEALPALTERLSRYTLVFRALSKQALDTVAGLAGAVAHAGAKAFKYAALDNGVEFAKASAALGVFSVDAYFCHPYSSWEKGSVERQWNGKAVCAERGKDKPNRR